ncbi:SDR family oxidoreductase [Nocardia sp. NEAU-G5]|uniref:SDR family oxidoreductase n=1 Tax=Nocardia albiluteola TaxID=2842303 RepID=A0ABS6BE37_9NOCA|nr:SDR family oxidoreductase [Nocardia albiluteola]MBU3067675.1 SDR family oxidoreductase [Nocardia albiluteola]
MTAGSARLRDKVVLLTGSSGGIGVEIARRLADEGAVLVLTDLDAEACARVAAEIPNPDLHQVLELDISDEQQWRNAVEVIAERFSGLDALVANGAIGSLATVVDEDLERYNKVIAISQTGTWLGMKHAGALIERTGGGSIVNLCSVLGTVGGLGNSLAYAAAKGAVRTMTKNAALHWATKGVRVNSVHPAFIQTRQLLDRYEGSDRHRAMLEHTPMGRLGRAEEVAAAVAFLASDDSTFITGTELYVDGGWTCV